MVELPPAFAAERESLDRARSALREAGNCIRTIVKTEGPSPAADIVRHVASSQNMREATVKMALLMLLQQGEVRLTAGYRLKLADQ